jgi:hypothetical protein
LFRRPKRSLSSFLSFFGIFALVFIDFFRSLSGHICLSLSLAAGCIET